MVLRVSSRTAKAMQRNSDSKTQKINKKSDKKLNGILFQFL